MRRKKKKIRKGLMIKKGKLLKKGYSKQFQSLEFLLIAEAYPWKTLRGGFFKLRRDTLLTIFFHTHIFANFTLL